MPGKLIGFAAVIFLHDLFTAVWIGGMAALGLSVLPAVRKVLGTDPRARRLMAGIRDRLRIGALVSIAGLIVTGLLLYRRSPQFHGLFAWDSPYTAALTLKHLMVAAMVVVSLVRGLALGGGRRPAEASLPAASALGGLPAAGRTGGGGPPPEACKSQAGRERPELADRAGLLLLLVNLVLGLGVLFLSGLIAALAGRPPA